MSSRRNRRGGGGGEHGGGGEERWLLPYADMITLLLGLFIVLFAMSTLNTQKFDQVRRSLAETFDGGAALSEPGDVLPGSNGVMDPTAPSAGQIDAAISLDVAAMQAKQEFDKESEKLQQIQKQLGLGKDVSVTRTEIGIQISIAGDALFESGSYQLTSPGIRTQLTSIAKELERFGHPIRIEGHTDGAPMAGEFGNDALASNRALAVKFYFAKQGYPKSLMHIASYGPDRPKVQPKSPTASVSQNRRIEIIVLEPGNEDTVPNEVSSSSSSAGGGASAASTPSPADIEIEAQLNAEFDDALISELATTGRGTE